MSLKELKEQCQDEYDSVTITMQFDRKYKDSSDYLEEKEGFIQFVFCDNSYEKERCVEDYKSLEEGLEKFPEVIKKYKGVI